jgi:hypothetical protein
MDAAREDSSCTDGRRYGHRRRHPTRTAGVIASLGVQNIAPTTGEPIEVDAERPATTRTRPTTGRVQAVDQVWRRRGAASWRLGLIFVVASGLAIGWGASIERLTSESDAVPELVAAQGDTQPVSAAVVERDMYGQTIAVIRALPRHVVDRWYEQAGKPVLIC